MGQGTRPRATTLALAASLVFGCARHAPVASPAATVPPPRLLVTIVVDQLAAWIAAERWPQLAADGGFARLRREGLYVEDLRYEHSVTDTAPGHAALFTGNVPAQTGIFANETLPSTGGPARSILADPATQVVGVDTGVVTGPGKEGSSLARLTGDTVADRFVAEVPGAQVFSFSLKDRATLFGSGRTPDVALWLDTDLGELVTSTKFPTPPSWVRPLAGKAAVTAAAQVGWRLTEAEQVWVQAHAETADISPGEGSPAGLGDHFPHPIQSAKALRGTAQGDVLLFGLARAAIEVARNNHRPTLLALSFSSHDYVGHIFGPHSWEAWDELYRLDRALADFFATLDGAFGPDGYAVMLSADHGSVALPELAGTANDPWCKHAQDAHDDRWQRACGPRLRVDTRAATAAVEAALVAALGAGPWTIGISDPYLHLTAQASALPAERRTLLLATVAKVLQPMGFAEVIDARAVRPPCGRGEALADLLCSAISPRGDGDLYLVVRPGTFLGVVALEGHGINHGSPYLYDRSVPLLVRAPGRVAPGKVRHTPASFATFARTASALLGVHAPATDRPGEDLTVSSSGSP